MNIKKLFSTILTLLFIGICMGSAQTDSVLVCDVKFKKQKFNNPHAGSGFLLEYDGKVYACTAKHVLFFAKTDSMKTISFGGKLKSWEFVSKKNEKNKVLAGKLINENPNEAIEMPPKGDWLVFEIQGDVPKDIIIYSLREKPLNKGEKVSFLGYPYNTTKPVNVVGSLIDFTKEGNLSLDVPKGNYAGCSGGPVLDTNGKLVGLVSMGYFDQKENKMVFEPSSSDNFKALIKSKERRTTGCAKTEFYSNLAGIISPNMEYLGRGKISMEEAMALKHYRFAYNGKEELLSIQYFDKDQPDNDSYYGTHEVRYVHHEDRLIRSYHDVRGEKSAAYRHYYLGGDIHKEVFQLDKNNNKTFLVLRDSLGNQIESGIGTYLFEFKRIDDRTFVQKQFKKNGTPNVLTTYFPFQNAKISISENGFLKSIVNVDDKGNPILSLDAGYASVAFDFDEYGNELGWSFHDVSGNLANRKNHLNMDYRFAKVAYTFNWKNKKLGLYNGFKESYFDMENKPVENDKGVNSIHYEYDQNGIFLNMTKYDLNGEKVE